RASHSPTAIWSLPAGASCARARSSPAPKNPKHRNERSQARPVIRDVVLVPGLWMPGAAMSLLAVRLARLGYAPRTFAYRGRGAIEANVESLAAFARDELGGREAHFMG